MPKAVFWYTVYCYVFAVFNLGLLAISVWFVVKHDQLANEILPASVVLAVGLVCAPLALFLAGLNVWLTKTTSLKNPWAVHMSNIAVGLGTCVLFPCALPLLIFWFHPNVKAYYGRDITRP